MAGHSKWANIKHRKGAQDKKIKIFTRCIKDIYVAVKEGGDELAQILDSGLLFQMPKG